MKCFVFLIVLTTIFITGSSKVEAGLTAPSSPQIYYPNPGTLEVPEPGNFTRVVAVSGPRGMYKNFYNLLLGTKLIGSGGMWQGGKTLLIIDGNLIGQGPENINVLDLLILLQQQARVAGGRIMAILGEEEARLLANPNSYKNDSLQADLTKRQMTIQQLVTPGISSGITTRGMFLRSLPIAAKIGHWLFSYSGLYPNVIWPQFQYATGMLMTNGRYSESVILGPQSILTAKDWFKDPKTMGLLQQRLTFNDFYGVVFSNQNNVFGRPNEIATLFGRFIKIDVGMGLDAENKQGTNDGRLLIFPYPKQMESLMVPELLSMGPSGVIVPIN